MAVVRLKRRLNKYRPIIEQIVALMSRVISAGDGATYRACAFRSAAQRRFVASIIAFRPASLSFRFVRAGAVDEAAPVCFLDSAHLFRC